MRLRSAGRNGEVFRKRSDAIILRNNETNTTFNGKTSPIQCCRLLQYPLLGPNKRFKVLLAVTILHVS